MAANPRTKQATLDGATVESETETETIACADGSSLSPTSVLQQTLKRGDVEKHGVERVCRWAATARRHAEGGDGE